MDLTTLNDRQLEAVYSTEGAVLVLAGAGSGKTRVLTHRVAYLINNKGVSPFNILAITFTNKAANEMKERLEKMLGEGSGVWISTFHSLCARILRMDGDKLGYDSKFTIYSDDDSLRVIKRIITNKHIEIKNFAEKVAFHISEAKIHLHSPSEYINQCGDFNATYICEVYQAYEDELRAANAMDYDDLMVKTYKLFTEYPDVLKKYSDRFQYIHIDEYQDTSRLQYKLASMLALEHGNLFAVGDEDQSIYSWRGADISNILDFTKDFPKAKLIKLEQNYRSTTNILNAANALIANNNGRYDKKLWSEAEAGERVEIYSAGNDRDEAEYVVSQIASKVNFKGKSPSDFAILVRLNALTRKFEERLRLYNIPYKIYCGTKFFDRKEVKDVLAYFRAVVNPRDNDAFLRIINTPKRGIGDAVTDEMVLLKDSQGLTIADILFSQSDGNRLSAKSEQKLKTFKELYAKLFSAYADMQLGEFADYVVEEAGFNSAYSGDKEEDISHRENISQLIAGIKEFEKDNKGATLEEYLQSVSLLSESDDIQTDNYVTISTVHSVKGLEFNTVFVVGLEENVFPAQSHTKSNHEIEEERRVMYVAMTRAREKLYLTWARERYMYQGTVYNSSSRFLREVQDKIYPNVRKSIASSGKSINIGRCNNHVGSSEQPSLTDVAAYVRQINGIAAKPQPSANNSVADFHLGDKVSHPRYGVGRIIQVNGENANIAFDGLGIKQFNMRIAPIKKI